MIVVVFGASGSGKSTVGVALADRLGWRFIDGDSYHSPASVDRIRAGLSLGDEDRWPWLHRLHA
jgi:carbohydrate kinase (thermoresistant glucokinase family)